jgi:Rrf2 family protein
VSVRFSSKAHYGLRAMVELAQRHGSGPVALAEIAQAENISQRYLEQLIAKLRHAGLVKATRGVQGGYQLRAAPTSITVGEVLRALEGPISTAQCASEVESDSCTREAVCASRQVWRRVRLAIADVLDSITLSDLCAGGDKKRPANV